MLYFLNLLIIKYQQSTCFDQSKCSFYALDTRLCATINIYDLLAKATVAYQRNLDSKMSGASYQIEYLNIIYAHY